jgi:hypothetical protein
MQGDVVPVEEVVLEMDGHHLRILVDIRSLGDDLPIAAIDLVAVCSLPRLGLVLL